LLYEYHLPVFYPATLTNPDVKSKGNNKGTTPGRALSLCCLLKNPKSNPAGRP
jgi:hypothetical protein